MRVDLPGVGRNLQDRYEVGVVNRMSFDAWEALAARVRQGRPAVPASGRPGDAGVYATNGAGLACHAIRARARAARPVLHGAAGALLRLLPRLSRRSPAGKLNYLTWVVLKAHTQNRAGRVTLRSADPRDPPQVNFRYFEEGNDEAGEDLEAWSSGIRFVRRHAALELDGSGLIAEEELPGAADSRRSSSRSSCATTPGATTPRAPAAIGAAGAGGVLDSDLCASTACPACAWSTPRCSRASPGSSSRARST